METFYFKLSPEIYEFANDDKTIYRFEEVDNEYRVFFKLEEDDEEEIDIIYTLEEVANSLVASHWIIIEQH